MHVIQPDAPNFSLFCCDSYYQLNVIQIMCNFLRKCSRNNEGELISFNKFSLNRLEVANRPLLTKTLWADQIRHAPN